MADEGAAPVTPTGTPAGGAAAPSSPAIDPAEYAELRSYREQTQNAFATLEPIADDVKWLLEDQGNLDFIRNARKSYEESRRAREPQLDANGQLLLERFKPALDYVNKLQERETQMTQQQIAEHNRKVRSEADALIAKDARLAHNGRALLQSIAKYGDERGITSLTEAYNEWAKDVGTPEARAATPPRSLRAEGGGGGVPGPSTAAPIKSAKDIRDRLRHAFAHSSK